MSDAVAKGKEALAAEEGKLKKFLEAVKKLFAKEFLWVLFVALVSLPLALALEYIIVTYVSEENIERICEALDGYSLFMGCYGISIVGFYFTRTIIGAIKTLTESKK